MERYPVVILVSANAEWQAVREFYQPVEVYASPYGEWIHQPISVDEKSVDVCILNGGWGKVAAAASAQYAIDTWSPELVINLGTCGGFSGHIKRNTIILVNKTLIYDIIEQMGDQNSSIAHYTTELDNSWLQKPYPYSVYEGLLLSGDRDLIPEQVEDLQRDYGAVAGDWESASIAYVSARNNTRCLILRVVSDLVGKGGGEVYAGRLDLYHQRARYAMQVLLSSLPDWLQCAGYGVEIKVEK
jgi:adenosylhomocysteine nucleosidase